MRLRCGKITKREVRRPIRRYVRRMTTPRYNNGEQSTSSIRMDIVSQPMKELVPSIASTPEIPSMMVALMTLLEEMILSPIP